MENFLPIQYFVLACVGILFLYTIYLIRIDKLSAHLAVSWIMTEVFLAALLSIRQLQVLVTRVIGREHLYSVAFIFVIGWIILLMLDTLTRVSELTTKTRAVVEENGLLRERVERLEEIIEKSKEKI